MKRYVLLLFSIVILALAVTGTNAAFTSQVSHSVDRIESVSPTPKPTATPVPTATPRPTATPTPTPVVWTGEYEVIIQPGDAWRTLTDDNYLGARVNIIIKNNTNASIKDWRLNFNVNADVLLVDSWKMTKQSAKSYQFRRPDEWNMEIPAKGQIANGTTFQTYALSLMQNNRLTRSTNPDFRQLSFYNVSMQVATDHFGGSLKTLNPNQVKITYNAPSGYARYISDWLDSFYVPPGWAVVH